MLALQSVDDVVIGVDTHKHTHTAAAVTSTGAVLGGWSEALATASFSFPTDIDLLRRPAGTARDVEPHSRSA